MKGDCHDRPAAKRFVATRTFRAECPSCPPGLTGAPVVMTRQGESCRSLRDAEEIASENAKRAAFAALDCVFTSTQTATASCPGHPEISVTREATSTSPISQADADAKAFAAALSAAAGALVCEVDIIPGFTLVLCLDQTGSIGVGGAARGIEIIDLFRNEVGDNRINGIGFVSFGDIMCETFPINADLDLVRARLQAVVDSGGSDPVFFQDGGNDIPENGIDALQVALDELAVSAVAQSSQYRYIFLKTDTAGFAHNANDPAAVLSALLSSVVSKTWIEFDEGNTDAADEGEYASALPESAKISHGDFDPTS